MQRLNARPFCQTIPPESARCTKFVSCDAMPIGAVQPFSSFASLPAFSIGQLTRCRRSLASIQINVSVTFCCRSRGTGRVPAAEIQPEKRSQLSMSTHDKWAGQSVLGRRHFVGRREHLSASHAVHLTRMEIFEVYCLSLSLVDCLRVSNDWTLPTNRRRTSRDSTTLSASISNGRPNVIFVAGKFG